MSGDDDLDVILIGLGANLPSAYGAPRDTLAAALARLSAEAIGIGRVSRNWLTEPVPVSDQPWFVNAVAAVDTSLPPAALLALLHQIEADFGRVRTVPNAPRLIDLDLLAYGRRISRGAAAPLLPHPRLAERAFVLLPLRDIAPRWTDPVSGRCLDDLIGALPADQKAVPETLGAPSVP